MSDQFLGEIRLFGCNFAPYGWALCNGQILPIPQYSALFSLLGTYYGGNGTSTFALPNLQSNMALNAGSGAGLEPYDVGETDGASAVTITIATLPAHTHQLSATATAGRVVIPTISSALGGVARGAAAPYAATSNTSMASQSISIVGGSQPHDNMMPSLAMNFCIALQGVFPARN